MSERFKVIPAAYLLLRDQDRILLQLRRNTGYMDGYWAMAAAGHIESGESAIEAVRREAKEEVDIDIAAEDLEPLCTMHRTQPLTGPTSERVDFFFQCRSWIGTPRVAEPDKSDGIEWFDIANPPERTVAHEALVIAKLAAGDLPPILQFGF